MSTQLYFFCVVMYILGQLLCLMWQTIPSLKKKAAIANTTFSLKAWFACDWNIVVGNMVFGAILILALKLLHLLCRWYWGLN